MSVFFIVLASVVGVFGIRASSLWHANRTANLGADKVALRATNELERSRGRQIAEGLLDKQVVQVLTPTHLELSSGNAATWSVVHNGEEMALTPGGPAALVEFAFANVGTHTVVAIESTGASHTFDVTSRAVRYELRDLSRTDREAYFDALHKFYVISQTEGKKLYGDAYTSASEIIREHLYGAAGKDCDHWHDDAGILMHHVGITWAFENSLRMINPATAAHYWDYTREEAEGLEWYESPVFGEEWFGSNAPANADHIVDTGRFAYTPIMADARGFSEITNPYGLLRSPWNTNPVPYLLRSNETFFSFAASYTKFPSCSQFATWINSSLADVTFAIDGELHGPVHLMIGGHWGAKHDWKALNISQPVFMLLMSKVLWREGFARVPESCSADTPASECVPHCPASIVSPNGEALTSAYAKAILNKVSAFAFGYDESWWSKQFKNHGDGKLDFVSLLEELCHVGYAGEMFTSSAPQDPTFWPLHGNAERFVQYLRILKNKGVVEFDETWGYRHNLNVASETGRVCDWSGVGAPPDMPACDWGTCPGHKEDDLLPFTNLFAAQGDRLLTNAEFYDLISPFNDDLPYMYDGISHWKGCTDDSLLVEAGLAPAEDTAGTAEGGKSKNLWFSFGGWM